MKKRSLNASDHSFILHPSSFIPHLSSFLLPCIFSFFFRALGDNLSALQPKMGSSAGHHIMSQPSVSSWQIVRRCALACAALWLAAGSFASARVIKAHAGDDVGAGGSNLSDAAPKWLVVRLRSFVPGASGRVVVEPTTAGGRVRLTAARLPLPDSVAPNAHAYIVWATGGQVRRLGELRRDARGNAEFEFAHPGGFESYSVVVTAETDASAERPMGSPVFSTRAGEVSALYPTKTEPRAEESAGESAVRARTVTRGGAKEAAKETAKPRAKSNAAMPNTMPTPTPNAATSTARVKTPPPRIIPKTDAPATTTPRAPSTSSRASSAPNAAEFYESIDTAVEDTSVARTLTLAGEDGARAATGDARVATRDGTAYVRVRFRRVPSPSRFGVRKYVMWAQAPADAPLFLRALPARGLNRRTTYARRRNVGSTDFQLLVTAEHSYPHPRPRGRRVLQTVNR
jgi:hypothetical protein